MYCMLLTPWQKLPEIMQNEAVKPYYDILRRKRVSLFFKRLGDIIIALIVIILLSPIMLCAAVAVKINDGGPAFYRQKRVGRDLREIRIFKFRTMVQNAEADGKARLASEDDPRILPIGRLLRATRLDELPQIYNILKGDMSIVGPRPERPELAAELEKEIPEFSFRLQVKAGLTGYAQVYGKYNTTPYDKLKLDLTYIEDYSVWMDIKLMLLTLKILFKAESTEGVDSKQITAMKTDSEEDNN